MRSFRSALTAALLALAVGAAGAASVPSYADPAGPDLPAQANDRAREVLALARDALAGKAREVHLTEVMRDLFLLRGELAGAERAQADRILARPDGETPPTDPDANWDHIWNKAQEAPPVCDELVCVHYVTSGSHAATEAEAQATLATVAHSWRRQVDDLGYRRPRKDGTRGDRDDPETQGKLDVYLAELSGLGAFGYAVPESDPGSSDDGNPRTATGYLVLDQDFAEYGCPRPAGCRRVTAAHELFHLVQFAYTTRQHGWFMESTATWMEERVFDRVNDNRNYLQYGQLSRPGDPLVKTTDGAPYGNWLLHEFYTQRKGNLLVRRAWIFSARGMGWKAAMSKSLARSGWSWSAMYSAFAAHNNVPAQAYREGSAYTKHVSTPVAGRYGSWQRRDLRKFSSVSHRFTPSKGLFLTTSRLRIELDLGSGAHHRAYVILRKAGGGLARYRIKVDSTGAGARTFPFSTDDVRDVTLTLANAGPRNGVPERYRATRS